MLRHSVNIGLLFSFLTLAVTGIMSFVLPFAITTTRVHIVFGFATILLVGLHLATRLRYFSRIARESVQRSSRAKPQVPRWLLTAIAIGWTGLLYTSFYGTPPAANLVATGYEARNKAEILRTNGRTAFEHIGDETRVVQLKPNDKAVLVEVEIEYAKQLEQRPAVALWAETTRGAMIETLYIDERLAYADDLDWGGGPTSRNKILPIWRHRWTLLSGVAPGGEVDALTGATPKHSFSLSEHLETDADQVVVYLEINLPNDTDENWTDRQIGQPSVVYAAFVDLTSNEKYHLMQLVGHGGGAESSGEIAYDVEALSSARSIVEMVLVRVEHASVE